MKNYTTGILLLALAIVTVIVIYGFSVPRAQDTTGAAKLTSGMPALDGQEVEEKTVEPVQEPAAEAPLELPEAETVQPQVKEFQISADEKRFSPATIQISEGDKVRITFNFNDEDIYYGGLDIRSNYFNVQYRKNEPQKSKTIEFTAEETFTYTGYWPSSNNRKASGRIVVN